MGIFKRLDYDRSLVVARPEPDTVSTDDSPEADTGAGRDSARDTIDRIKNDENEND